MIDGDSYTVSTTTSDKFNLSTPSVTHNIIPYTRSENFINSTTTSVSTQQLDKSTCNAIIIFKLYDVLYYHKFSLDKFHQAQI